jgi:hypothetical protein
MKLSNETFKRDAEERCSALYGKCSEMGELVKRRREAFESRREAWDNLTEWRQEG